MADPVSQGHGKVFAVANTFSCVLFLVSASLQYNDPDAPRWMAVYGLAALACGLFRRRAGLWLAAPVLGGSLMWAAWLAPAVLPGLAMGDLFRTMKAEEPSIELGREFLGLLIVAAWMAVLLFRSRSVHPPSSS